MKITHINPNGKIKIEAQTTRQELLNLLNAKTDCITIQLDIINNLPIQLRIWIR